MGYRCHLNNYFKKRWIYTQCILIPFELKKVHLLLLRSVMARLSRHSTECVLQQQWRWWSLLMIWVQWVGCPMLIMFFMRSAMKSTRWPRPEVKQSSCLQNPFYMLSFWGKIVFHVAEVDRRNTAKGDLSCNLKLFRSWVTCKLLLCFRDNLLSVNAVWVDWTCCQVQMNYRWVLPLFLILCCFGLKCQSASCTTNVQQVQSIAFLPSQINTHLIFKLVEHQLACDDINMQSCGKSVILTWSINSSVS